VFEKIITPKKINIKKEWINISCYCNGLSRFSTVNFEGVN
jgi:hypothetical protein